MFRELVVYLKVRPDLKQLKELCSMPLSWSRFFQILAVALHILNLVLPVVPPKAKPGVTLAIGIIQLILHDLAGNANPDGTPAVVAYLPPKK